MIIWVCKLSSEPPEEIVKSTFYPIWSSVMILYSRIDRKFLWEPSGLWFHCFLFKKKKPCKSFLVNNDMPRKKQDRIRKETNFNLYPLSSEGLRIVQLG